MTTPADQPDPIAWLRQQLDEDEAATRELLCWVQQTILTLQDPKLLGKHIPGWHDWPKVERMCRVRLAEVDAKRRIMEIHGRRADLFPSLAGGSFDNCCDGCGYEGICDDPVTEDINDCPILRALALPYADRPGYRDEWRPA